MTPSPQDRLDDVVTSAAGLHAIGYCPDVASTGFPVAYHSGAEFEAEERGMVGELAMFTRPRQDDLDGLVAADMTTGPTGDALTIDERGANP